MVVNNYGKFHDFIIIQSKVIKAEKLFSNLRVRYRNLRTGVVTQHPLSEFFQNFPKMCLMKFGSLGKNLGAKE